VTTSTTTDLTGVFCGNGATVNVCSILQDIAYTTGAAARAAADSDIATNKSATIKELENQFAANDTAILNNALIGANANESMTVAGGTAAGSSSVNASSIPRFTDSLGRAINGTNVTITGTGVDGPNILDIGLGQIKDMANPTASQDAATKNYVDTEDAADVTAAKAYTDTNASKWLSVTSNRFAYSNNTVLQAGTSFTVNSTTQYILVRLVGGGGGGGGCSGSGSNYAAAGGGGSGGYAEEWFDVTPSTAYTYAIGALGAGGSSGANPGSAGTASSFTVAGTTVTANGGSGGTASTGSTSAKLSLGGNGAAVSTNGDINGAGSPGGTGYSSSTTIIWSGSGGSSQWGGGGNSRSTAGAGNAGTGYGAGGGGASCTNANRAGGAGTAGAIVVCEFAA
jgi:hypothetical protein